MSGLKIDLIPPHRIPYEWSWLGQVLEPAILIDKTDPLDVFGSLVIGDARVVSFYAPGMAAIAVVSLGETTDTRNVCCWVEYLSGQLTPSRAIFERTIGDGMDYLEAAAQNAGAREMRIQGRDWFPVMKKRGYERFGSAPNEIMKVLR